MSVSPTSNTPDSSGSFVPSAKTKAADPSIILFDDAAYPAIVLEQMLFEDIAGQELLSIARTTDLSGAQVSNRLISNASELSIKYGSQNIIYIPDSLLNYFKNFSISLFDKLPLKELDHYLSSDVLYDNAAPNVFYDYDSDLITIIFKDFDLDEQVEVEVANPEETFSDTIDIS